MIDKISASPYNTNIETRELEGSPMAAWPRKNNAQVPVRNNTEALLARIDGLVKQEQQKIEDACMEIGRGYVKLHPTDYEPTFRPQMQAIRAANATISAYGVQTLLITGAATCPKCGHNAPKGSRFCNQCGEPIPVIPYEKYDQCPYCGGYVEKGQPHCPVCRQPVAKVEEEKIRCRHCGEWIEKGNKFCSACGLAPTEPSKPEPEQSKEKRCPNPACGKVMPPQMHFCTECGTKL